MPRTPKLALAALGFALVMPVIVSAQDAASISGAVTDTTGGVLPGVTVVASSPALLGASRTVATDGTGTYRFVSLRPGIYTVTFTLDGFQTLVREDIELQGSFAAAVDVQLAVGSVQETVTVTGASPVVDIQQATQETVFDSDLVSSLPTGRSLRDLALLVPGVQSSIAGNVGGSNILRPVQFTVHGSDNADYRVEQDGFVMGNAYQSFTGYIPNLGAAEGSTISTAGAGAEWWGGGVVLGIIPKEGTNSYAGEVFVTGATEGFQSDNFSQRVEDRGLTAPDRLKNTWDLNPSFGGPLIEDKLWIFASGRWNRHSQFAGGTFFNKNAGIADNFIYEPDLDRQAFSDSYTSGGGFRLTYQASEWNKFAISYDYQTSCACDQVGLSSTGWGAGLLATPEAAVEASYPDVYAGTVTWTNPVSNRLLLEAGFMAKLEKNGASGPRPPAGDPALDLIGLLDFGTGFASHGRMPTVFSTYSFFSQFVPQGRASLSYVTGSNSLKVGFSHLNSRINRWDTDNNLHSWYYAFTGAGPLIGQPADFPFPLSVVQTATPYQTDVRQSETGLYVQDTYTAGQLTLNGGVRLDLYSTMHPSTVYGPSALVPNRDFTTPDIDHFDQKDITPRFSAVYDLTGDGKTAVRAAVNKYSNGHSTDVFDGNPSLLMTNFAVRDWTDLNGNLVPDCDLTSPAAQFGPDLCGPISENWGQANFTPDTRFNPDTIGGWGNRGYNWEFSAGVQRELSPGVSVDVSYFRKVFGNIVSTFNEGLGLEDFDQYTLTAPIDPRLPGGGGYEVGPLIDPNPELVAAGIPVDNLETFADEFGTVTQHWNGVDVSVNARFANGLTLAGGTSTGRTSTNDCDVVQSVGPSSGGLGATGRSEQAGHLLYCDVSGNFLTDIKAYGSYIIPRIDVLVSGSYQSITGPEIESLVTYSVAEVAAALGRPPGLGGTVDVQIIDPSTEYGERMHQVDFRIGKLFNAGGMRATVNLDLFNAFNADSILSESTNFATFRAAQRILLGRIIKLSATVGF